MYVHANTLSLLFHILELIHKNSLLKRKGQNLINMSCLNAVLSLTMFLSTVNAGKQFWAVFLQTSENDI